MNDYLERQFHLLKLALKKRNGPTPKQRAKIRSKRKRKATLEARAMKGQGGYLVAGAQALPVEQWVC